MRSFDLFCLLLCRSCLWIRAWSCCRLCWTMTPKIRSSCRVHSPTSLLFSHLLYGDHTLCNRSSTRSAESSFVTLGLLFSCIYHASNISVYIYRSIEKLHHLLNWFCWLDVMISIKSHTKTVFQTFVEKFSCWKHALSVYFLFTLTLPCCLLFPTAV